MKNALDEIAKLEQSRSQLHNEMHLLQQDSQENLQRLSEDLRQKTTLLDEFTRAKTQRRLQIEADYDVLEKEFRQLRETERQSERRIAELEHSNAELRDEITRNQQDLKAKKDLERESGRS